MTCCQSCDLFLFPAMVFIYRKRTRLVCGGSRQAVSYGHRLVRIFQKNSGILVSFSVAHSMIVLYR